MGPLVDAKKGPNCCPLCQGEETFIADSLSAESIASALHDEWGIEVAPLVVHRSVGESASLLRCEECGFEFFRAMPGDGDFYAACHRSPSYATESWFDIDLAGYVIQEEYRRLRRPLTILDVGSGAMRLPLSLVSSPHTVWASDITPPAGHHSRIHFVRASLDQLAEPIGAPQRLARITAEDGLAAVAAVPQAIEAPNGPRYPLTPDGFMPDGGLGFRHNIPFETFESDQTGDSRLVLLEDGIPLGPPQTAHSIIRAEGGGAFSHWGAELYMSSSDGSDPRSGTHLYEVIELDVRPDEPRVSLLTEDGIPLGPRVASHALVRQRGRGVWAQWGSRVLFSSSDGSMPAMNGRVYAVQQLRPTPGTLDVVTATQVVEHLGKPLSAVQSLLSLCRHGGVLFIAVPNALRADAGSVLDWPPHHLSRWTPRTLTHAIEAAGGEIIAVGVEIERGSRVSNADAILNDDPWANSLRSQAVFAADASSLPGLLSGNEALGHSLYGVVRRP